jgi:hypothetical protein
MNSLKSSLPHSPRKRACILSAVVDAIYNKPNVESPGRPSRQLSETVKQNVIDFFQHDDVSRMSPGMRDFMRAHSGKERVFLQKVRYI